MSSATDRDIACGDYNGNLVIYDIESGKEKFRVKAHGQIINAIDGIGGKGPEYGAAEIVTGSRDGCVTVWDPRQTGKIVSLEPDNESNLGEKEKLTLELRILEELKDIYLSHNIPQKTRIIALRSFIKFKPFSL